MDIVVVKLFLVKFLAAVLIQKVSFACLREPAVLVDAARLLVNVEALTRLHEDRFAVLVVEVALKLVWVEVVLLDAEGGGDLTAVVDLIGAEHGLPRHVLNHVVGFGVGQVTSRIHWFALLVVLAAILVLKNNDVAFLISVEVTKNIVLVEGSQTTVRWNSDKCILLRLLLEIF